MKDNLAPYAQIEAMLKKVGYGQVTLSMQVHDGKIVAFISNNFVHRQFGQDGGAEAIQDFLEKLKEHRDQQHYGSITGSFTLRRGAIKELVVQSNVKKMFDPNVDIKQNK